MINPAKAFKANVKLQFLDSWWSQLVQQWSPLMLTGVIIPVITLAVYWTHGLLHLMVDITRWPPLYKYKIQPNKHLNVNMLPKLFGTLLKVQVLVFLPVCFLFGVFSVNTKYGLKTGWFWFLKLVKNRIDILKNFFCRGFESTIQPTNNSPFVGLCCS